MRILFIGNFDVSYTTESHHRATFQKLGHTVISIQENRTSIAEIKKASEGVDMVYWTHTHSFRIDPKWEPVVEMLARFKMRGIPTVGYHLDLWMGLQRQKDLETDPYWGLEHFFTVDKLMADWLNENTTIKGYFLPPGVYENECYIAEPNVQKYPHEIIFVGSKNYHSEWSYRPQLIEWLEKTYGSRFAQYGGGGLGTIRGHDLNVLYASAKIVVGDSLCKNFDYPFYTSDRIFETTGRGGFLIYPWIKGLEFMFDDGELQTYKYGDFEGLQRTIDFYLSNDEKREKMRLAAHQRTKSTHTYTQRLKSLLETLNL